MSKAETEQVYGSREVATLLGLGSAMLRRYAVAYEQATGVQLQLDRRDGRIFTEKDLAVLSQARQLVATQGVPVDTAIKTALAQPESAPKPLAVLPTANGEALAAVLTQAISEANRPLLSELQNMNRELQAVRAELSEMRADRKGQDNAQRTVDLQPSSPIHPVAFGAGEWAIDPAEEVSAKARSNHTDDGGALVRLARRLERWLTGK